MRTICAMLLVALALAAGDAFAQCATTGALNQAQIRSALGSKWACARDGSEMWNQQIATAFSGSFKECHSGLSTGPDPIDNNKGTFVINSNPQLPATITYTYPPNGGSYEYRVYEVTANSVYSFCRLTDGKTYTVHITSCPPPALNSCP